MEFGLGDSVCRRTDSTFDIASVFADIRAYDILAIAVILVIAVIIAKIVTTFMKRKLSDRMEKSELNILICGCMVGNHTDRDFHCIAAFQESTCQDSLLPVA